MANYKFQGHYERYRRLFQLDDLPELTIEPLETIYPLVTALRNHRRDLNKIFSTEYGLLDELVRRGVITSQAAERVAENSTQLSKINSLVQELTRDPDHLTQKTTELFDALDETQHKHVSNFIRNDGIRLAEYGDHWPLIRCDIEITRINNYRDKFIELIDTRNNLLNRMLSARCINRQQLRQIEARVTDEEKNDVLLTILRRGSLATYNTFILSLVHTKQHQIVSLLAPDLPARLNVRPWSEQQQSRIQTNYDAVVSILDTTSELVARLHSACCITIHQKVYVESATTPTDRTKRLVDIMRRGSGRDFDKFVKYLNGTGQKHVSRILKKDGLVVPIAVSIGGIENVEEAEDLIIDQMKALLEREYHKRRTVFRLLTELQNKAITILDLKKGSIVLFYFCESLRGLHCLYDLYIDDQLREMLQENFTALLRYRDVSITRIHWSASDYNSCVRNLRNLIERSTVEPTTVPRNSAQLQPQAMAASRW